MSVFVSYLEVVGEYPVGSRRAELVDARDLKSLEPSGSYRFDSGLRHTLPAPVGKRGAFY